MLAAFVQTYLFRFFINNIQLLQIQNYLSSIFITCCCIDGRAHHTDTGVVTGQHGNGVVLATCQITEITVGVGAVTFVTVAEATPGVHGIGCGTTCGIPCYRGDTRPTVHLCCEVGGNTRSWSTEMEQFSSGFSDAANATNLQEIQHHDCRFIPVLKIPETTGSPLHVFVWPTTLMT